MLNRVFPGPAAELDDAGLAALYAHVLPGDGSAWVRANVVATADGAAVGPDGDSRSISSPTDRALLVVQRRAADVVLVGSGTATHESYRPGRTPIAVVSTALDVELDAALYADPSTVLLTTEAAPPGRIARAGCAVVVLPGDRVDPAAAIAALVGRGLPRVLCEGGPRWLGAVVGAGLLDELCMTVSPMVLAGPASRVATGPAPAVTGLDLASVCTDGGALFLRYRRSPATGPARD